MTPTTPCDIQSYDQQLAEFQADRGDIANYTRELAAAVHAELTKLKRMLPLACQRGTCDCHRQAYAILPQARSMTSEALRSAVRRAQRRPSVVAAVPHHRLLPDSVLAVDLARRLDELELARLAD